MDVDASGAAAAAVGGTVAASQLTEAQITAVAVAVRELLLEQVSVCVWAFFSFLPLLFVLSHLSLPFFSKSCLPLSLSLTSSPLSKNPPRQKPNEIMMKKREKKKNSAAPRPTLSTTSSPGSPRRRRRPPTRERPSLPRSPSSSGGTPMPPGLRGRWLRSCSSRRPGGFTTRREGEVFFLFLFFAYKEREEEEKMFFFCARAKTRERKRL